MHAEHPTDNASVVYIQADVSSVGKNLYMKKSNDFF